MPINNENWLSYQDLPYNIEGIRYAKFQISQTILIENDVDIVAIQETHTEDENQLNKRGRISGYDLVGVVYHW